MDTESSMDQADSSSQDGTDGTEEINDVTKMDKSEISSSGTNRHSLKDDALMRLSATVKELQKKFEAENSTAGKTTVKELRKKFEAENSTVGKTNVGKIPAGNTQVGKTKSPTEDSKTVVELICPGFPHDETEDDAHTKEYLETVLGSCKTISVADFIIESTHRRGKETRIKVACACDRVAMRVIHEINKTIQDHKIRAQMAQQPQKSTTEDGASSSDLVVLPKATQTRSRHRRSSSMSSDKSGPSGLNKSKSTPPEKSKPVVPVKPTLSALDKSRTTKSKSKSTSSDKSGLTASNKSKSSTALDMDKLLASTPSKPKLGNEVLKRLEKSQMAQQPQKSTTEDGASSSNLVVLPKPTQTHSRHRRSSSMSSDKSGPSGLNKSKSTPPEKSKPVVPVKPTLSALDKSRLTKSKSKSTSSDKSGLTASNKSKSSTALDMDKLLASTPSKPNLGDEVLKRLSATVKELQKKSKVKKTAVELVCSNFPQMETHGVTQTKAYLKATLETCKGFKVANFDIERSELKENVMKIKVVCPSRAQARKAVHEINKKADVYKIRAKLDLPEENSGMNDVKENKRGKKENKAYNSCISDSPEMALQRKKINTLRKMATISTTALTVHHAKIEEKERILSNLDRLRGIALEHYDEAETTRMVHQQKLEELLGQRMEYEKYWRELIKKVNNTAVGVDSEIELEGLLGLCRIEVKKLKSALPIYASKSGIISTTMENDYVVLLGETGSGKSTQTPQYLYESELSRKGLIACIQPRQVAAVSLACQVAKEMGTHVGGLVGYKAGYQCKMSPHTKVVYTTNHSILKEIIKDPLLKEYSCLLVDEAHERSIYCDLLLGMIKEAKKHRPELRVIVMSATIDPRLFVDYFEGCPIVKVSGRTFPVDLVYEHDEEYGDNYLREAVDKAKQVHRTEPQGDILVFLTSPAEIEKAVQETEQVRGVLSLPLHGRLQPDQQRHVFDPTPHGMRKIVYATNAAETSITIPGIKYVIDTGKAKEMSFDSTRGISSLDVQWISRSSADQRKGRAGRIESGKCFRLYTEETYDDMADGSVPEILKSSTEMAFLTLMSLGIEDPTKFDFVEAPPREVVEHAMKELQELGAVLPEGGLTELGKKLSKLNVEPKYGRLLLQAIEQGFGFDGMVMTALLTVGSSIFFRMGSPSEKQMADKLKARFCSPKGDIYTTYEVFKEWYDVPKKQRSAWCVENSINAKSLRMCLDFVNDLGTTLKKELSISVEMVLSNTTDFSGKMDRLIFECYRKNLACFTGHSKTGYYVPHLQTAIVLHPSSALQMLKEEPKWIVFTNVLETGRQYLLNPTTIELFLVEEMAGVSTMESVKCQMQLVKLDLEKVYSDSAGQSLLGRFIGARGQNVQRIEQKIHEEYLMDLPFAMDVSIPSCQLNFFCSPEICGPAVEYVKSELMSLKTELIQETIEVRPIPDIDVYYVLEEGATLKTVLMAEDYRTIIIHKGPFGFKDQDIVDFFARYGEIQRHFVFKQSRKNPGNAKNTSWGKITFVDETTAKHVMHRYRTKADVELAHFDLAPEERRTIGPSTLSAQLKFSWCRRPCTGLGFLSFNNCNDASNALDELRIRNTKGLRFVLSRKNATELCVRNVTPLLNNEDVRAIVDEAAPHYDYELKLIRKKLPPATEDEVARTKAELVEKIRDETLETTFHTELKHPSERQFDWFGFINTPNADIAQKICDICHKSIHMGCVPVNFELKLSGQILLNQRLYQRMGRQYERFIAEASVKFQPAQLSIEQNRKNQLFYLKVQAPDSSSFTEISRMCNDLVFGSLMAIPSEFDAGVLLSQNGNKFVQSLERQFQCAVEVDKRNQGIRVYANQNIQVQVKERIEQFLENNRDRISRRIELIGDEKPKGVMKYLIKNYGVDLQLFIAKTKVDSAEILLRQHILLITGTGEAVGNAFEEVEKASKAVLENPLEEAPAFTADCPICLCPITEKIYHMERCGHPYCYDCVKAMFTSAGRSKELPITCAKDDCGERIVVKDIKNLFQFNDDSYKVLVDAALEKFVLMNKEKFKYCITPDCKMVYKASSGKKVYQCPSCYVMICRSCHSPSHEGVRCDIYKIINSDEDRGVADWLKDNKKDRCLCPMCNALIEKAGGCNHMVCHMCKGHFCWICKKTFPNSGKTYAHLSDTHGGIGLPDEIPEDY